MSINVTAELSSVATRRKIDRDYMIRSRIRGYVDVTWSFALMAVLLWAGSVATAVWQFGLLYLAIGCMQHRFFFPVHDCIHYSLFPTKGENRFFGGLFSAFIGTSFDAIKDQHMEHHRDFGKIEDPGASDYFVRFQSRGELIRFMFGPLIGSILFAKLWDYLFRPGRVAAKNKDARDVSTLTAKLVPYTVILGVQCAVCAVLTSGFQLTELWRYPVLYVMPLVTVFLFFNRLRMFLEHGSLDYEVCDYFEGKRPTARSIHASLLERAIICGSSFNYHHEHHNHPNVPGWQLPRLHRELCEEYDPEDIRQTYFQAFCEIWKHLSRRE